MRVGRSEIFFCYVFLTLPFLLASFGMSIYSVVKIGEDEGVKVDVSGVGNCSNNTINVRRATAWTQYPATPFNYSVSVIQGFVNKNGIVWSENEPLQTFQIVGVEGMTVYTDRPLHVGKTCHFTLDSQTLNSAYLEWHAKLDKMIQACGVRCNHSEIEHLASSILVQQGDGGQDPGTKSYYSYDDNSYAPHNYDSYSTDHWT